jgi:hypothetical protein
MLRPLTFVSLIISSVYLFYLAVFSRMAIWHDSIGYEQLATLIADGHWLSYIQDGPNREPLYPTLIAAAMLIAKTLSVSYQSVVMVLQVFLLLFTQVLMVVMMTRLNIKEGVQAAIVLYSAFSPSLNNFTFILWSDFTPAVFILSGIILYADGWTKLRQAAVSQRQIVIQAAMLGVCLILLTFTKAAFEVIGSLIILSYLVGAFVLPKDSFKKIFLFVAVALLCHQGAIQAYKAINWRLNGNYVMTDRGSWALYGNTMRRMEPLTVKKLAAAAAVVPHPDVCELFMDKDICWHWGRDTVSNNYAFKKLQELSGDKNRDKKMSDLAVNAMLKNPLQAAALGFLEGCKMFFWEYYTETAYVIYPKWVQDIYAFKPLMYLLRCVLGILTVAAVVWGLFAIRTNILILSMLVWIIAYIIPYSFFFLFGRYALALGPVYLVLIAYLFSTAWSKRARLR